jgi:hypothetical protein
MIQIQTISAAASSLLEPRNGLASFAIKPNFDFKDKAVVVLGNSPAVGKVDVELLKRLHTIGVNRIFKAITPDVYLFTDKVIEEAEAENIKKFAGPILTWQNYDKSFVHDMPNARYFLLGNMSNPNLWHWPQSLKDPLIREGTTTAYCIQLAILGRARAVGILGVDFSVPNIQSLGKTDTHFYGSGAATRSTGGGDWQMHAPFYSAIPKWAEKFGVKVFNLSPFESTPIHKAGWPKLSLEDFARKFGDPDPVKADQL